MTLWQIVTSAWPLILGFIGLVVWAIRAESRSQSNHIVAADAKTLAQKALDDLALFRERAAQDYVTANTIAGVRRETTDAINRLGDRLDRVLEMKSNL